MQVHAKKSLFFQFWTKRVEQIFIAAAYLFPLICSIPSWIFTTNISYLHQNLSENTIVVETLSQHPKEMQIIRFYFSIFGFLIGIIQLCLYIVMFAHARMHHRKMNLMSVGLNSNSSSLIAHIKVAATGLILSIVLLAIVIFEFVASTTTNFNNYFQIYNVVSDFFNECNPYLLLACSSWLRERYFAMFGFAKCVTRHNMISVGSRPLNNSTRHMMVDGRTSRVN